MVLLNDGINRIRDLLVNDLYKGELGTDNTTPSESQTGLVSADATTLLSLTDITITDKQISCVYNLPSTTGNGITFKEFGILINSGNDFLTRQNFTDIAKTSDEELIITTFIGVNQG